MLRGILNVENWVFWKCLSICHYERKENKDHRCSFILNRILVGTHYHDWANPVQDCLYMPENLSMLSSSSQLSSFPFKRDNKNVMLRYTNHHVSIPLGHSDPSFYFNRFNDSITSSKIKRSRIWTLSWSIWKTKKKVPIQGLEPWYPAWKASMLTTYIISELCMNWRFIAT